MSKRFTAISAAGTLLLLVCVCVGFFLFAKLPVSEDPVRGMKLQAGLRGDDGQAEALSRDEIPVLSDEAERSRFYVLRDCDGFVGIYSPEDSEHPELITEISVARLRVCDAEKLREGITVEGVEELIRLLEDFGS